MAEHSTVGEYATTCVESEVVVAAPTIAVKLWLTRIQAQLLELDAISCKLCPRFSVGSGSRQTLCGNLPAYDACVTPEENPNENNTGTSFGSTDGLSSSSIGILVFTSLALCIAISTGVYILCQTARRTSVKSNTEKIKVDVLTNNLRNAVKTANTTNPRPISATTNDFRASPMPSYFSSSGGAKSSRHSLTIPESPFSTAELIDDAPQLPTVSISINGELSNAICGSFGPQEWGFQDTEVVLADPFDGSLSMVEPMHGKVAIVARGGCYFVAKVLNVQEAGAVCCLIINNENEMPSMMNPGGTSDDLARVTIPSMLVPKVEGQQILKALRKPGGLATVPLISLVAAIGQVLDDEYLGIEGSKPPMSDYGGESVVTVATSQGYLDVARHDDFVGTELSGTILESMSQLEINALIGHVKDLFNATSSSPTTNRVPVNQFLEERELSLMFKPNDLKVQMTAGGLLTQFGPGAEGEYALDAVLLSMAADRSGRVSLGAFLAVATKMIQGSAHTDSALSPSDGVDRSQIDYFVESTAVVDAQQVELPTIARLDDTAPRSSKDVPPLKSMVPPLHSSEGIHPAKYTSPGEAPKWDLEFRGATGVKASIINGQYTVLREKMNGRAVYERIDLPSQCCWMDPTKRWCLSSKASKDANEAKGYAISIQQGLASPEMASTWTVSIGSGFEIQPNVQVTANVRRRPRNSATQNHTSAVWQSDLAALNELSEVAQTQSVAAHTEAKWAGQVADQQRSHMSAMVGVRPQSGELARPNSFGALTRNMHTAATAQAEPVSTLLGRPVYAASPVQMDEYDVQAPPRASVPELRQFQVPPKRKLFNIGGSQHQFAGRLGGGADRGKALTTDSGFAADLARLKRKKEARAAADNLNDGKARDRKGPTKKWEWGNAIGVAQRSFGATINVPKPQPKLTGVLDHASGAVTPSKSDQLSAWSARAKAKGTTLPFGAANTTATDFAADIARLTGKRATITPTDTAHTASTGFAADLARKERNRVDSKAVPAAVFDPTPSHYHPTNHIGGDNNAVVIGSGGGFDGDNGNVDGWWDF
jgi:hypothetical protein